MTTYRLLYSTRSRRMTVTVEASSRDEAEMRGKLALSEKHRPRGLLMRYGLLAFDTSEYRLLTWEVSA